MSPAVTGPGPFLWRRNSALSRVCIRIATCFRLSRMSTTSSCTPSMLVYSWSTPSISTSVIALPGIDDSSTRRSALPRVWPKPRSNGSMTTRAWRGSTGCTLTTRGFNNSATDPCIESHFRLEEPTQTKPIRYVAEANRPAGLGSLRIELDDEVLVDVGQDVVPRRCRLEDATKFLVVDLDPVRQADLLGHGQCALNPQLLA